MIFTIFIINNIINKEIITQYNIQKFKLKQIYINIYK